MSALLGCSSGKGTEMCAYYNDDGVCTQKYESTFLFVHSEKKLNRSGSLRDYANSIYFRLGDTVAFVHNLGESFSKAELANKRKDLKGRFFFEGAACKAKDKPFRFEYKVERHDYYTDKVTGLSLLGTILSLYHEKRGWSDTAFQDWQSLCPQNKIAPFQLKSKLQINGTTTPFDILIIP